MTDNTARIAALTEAFPDLDASLVESLYWHHSADLGACVEALASYGHHLDLSASQNLEEQSRSAPVPAPKVPQPPAKPLPATPPQSSGSNEIYRCLSCYKRVFMSPTHLENFCSQCGANLEREQGLYESDREIAQLKAELNERCEEDPLLVKQVLEDFKEQLAVALPIDQSIALIQTAVQAIETALSDITDKIEVAQLFTVITDTVRTIKQRIRDVVTSQQQPAAIQVEEEAALSNAAAQTDELESLLRDIGVFGADAT